MAAAIGAAGAAMLGLTPVTNRGEKLRPLRASGLYGQPCWATDGPAVRATPTKASANPAILRNDGRNMLASDGVREPVELALCQHHPVLLPLSMLRLARGYRVLFAGFRYRVGAAARTWRSSRSSQFGATRRHRGLQIASMARAWVRGGLRLGL